MSQLVTPNIVILNVLARKVLNVINNRDISIKEALNIGINSSVTLSNYNFNKRNTKDLLLNIIEKKKLGKEFKITSETSKNIPNLPPELQDVKLVRPKKFEIEGEFNILEEGKLFEVTHKSEKIKLTCPKGKEGLNHKNKFFGCIDT